MQRTRVGSLAALLGLLAVAAAGAAVLAAPTAITGPVSAVGGTTATLNGTVNPGGNATGWWFEFGTSTAYGSKTSETPAGSGSANVAVSKGLTGLTPATTYHYRLVAKSSAGTSNGTDGLFTTASPPTVATGAASGVGPTVATVSGTVNPNGQPTTWLFEVGQSTSYGSRTAAQDAGSGTSARSVSAALTGLAPGRTYHYRLLATSSAGTTTGADATFVTAEPPAATTLAASSIGTTSAKLNARVDPNGRPTSYVFELGTTAGYGTATASSSAGSGSSAVSVSRTVTGLKPGTQYHFRVVASSDAGKTAGSDLTFTTQAPPAVATGPASAVGPTTASLGGTVNPNGRSTSVYVEYGTTTRYGSRTSTRSVGSGTAVVTVAIPVSRLSPGVTYHFRLVGSSALGTTRGLDMSFATTGAPGAVTGPVEYTSLSLTSARVSGTVSPRGLPTTWWFEYGRTRAYGFRTPVSGADGAGDIRVAAELTGLGAGMRWHYRLVAQSAAGTTAGADASFATPPRPLDASGRPLRCTVVGTQGPDLLRGGPGRDVVCGLGGNDRLLGAGGGDVLVGGPGADVLDGGTGNDALYGGAGADLLAGRSGNDLLDGGAGADRLVGGIGRDHLIGRAGNDVVLAADGGRDVIEGGPGRDIATIDRALDRVVGVERRRFA